MLCHGFTIKRVGLSLITHVFVIALKVNKIEKKVVHDYGCICSLDDQLKWSNELEHYVWVETASKETIEKKIEDFESVDLEDWEMVMV